MNVFNGIQKIYLEFNLVKILRVSPKLKFSPAIRIFF